METGMNRQELKRVEVLALRRSGQIDQAEAARRVAEGTAGSSREGKKYAQGGGGIFSPPSIKPEGLVMIAHSLNTKGFPAGRYRFTVEYQTPERKVLQTKSVEFELK